MWRRRSNRCHAASVIIRHGSDRGRSKYREEQQHPSPCAGKKGAGFLFRDDIFFRAHRTPLKIVCQICAIRLAEEAGQAFFQAVGMILSNASSAVTMPLQAVICIDNG